MFKNYRTFTLVPGIKSPTLKVVSEGKWTRVILHTSPVFEVCFGVKHYAHLRSCGYDTSSTIVVINRALAQTFPQYHITRTYFGNVKILWKAGEIFAQTDARDWKFDVE